MTSHISDTLAKLQCQFAEQLPDRLVAIQAHFKNLSLVWGLSEATVLHHLLHNLSGSAGTFGMLPVSKMASDLESKLIAIIKKDQQPTEQEWLSIGAAVDQLDQLARIQLNSNAPSLNQPSAPTHTEHSPLVYIVEDDIEQAECLSQCLQDDGYQVRIFTDPAEFRSVQTSDATDQPDAVVMDMIFPDSANEGVDLITDLRLGNTEGIPIVVVSVRDDLPGRLAAFRAGASRYLTKPFDTIHLVDILDGLTGRQPTEPYRVLLVDDEPLLLKAQAAVLQEAGMIVHTLSEPLLALYAVDDFAPDVVVLDVYMPEASGPELAAVLREREEQMNIPILFLSTETDMSEQLLALNLGGDDFLVKPIQANYFVEAVTARAQRARQNNITQRRLKNTLYEREREHLALDQHAIVSIADQAGNITYVNKLFSEISGYDQDELIGKNHRIIKSDQHPPEFYQHLWETISSGDTWQGEICNRSKNGDLYWVSSTITPFLDDDGKPYQYVSIRTDITHTINTKIELETTKEDLKATLDATEDGILAVNDKGNISFANEKFLQMWRIPNELLKKNADDQLLAHVEQQLSDPAAFRNKVQELYQSKEESLDTIEFIDGRVYERYSKPTIKDDIFNGRVWSFRDITQRIHADQALSESEEKYRALFELSEDPMWIIVDGNFVMSNKSAVQALGYDSADEMTNTPPSEISPEYQPDGKTSLEKEKEMMAITYAKGFHRFEWLYTKKNNDELLVEVSLTKIPYEGKQALFCVWHDITERKRNEEEVNLHKERLRTGQLYANIGTWEWSVQTGDLYWSERIAPLFGYPEGDLETSYENFLAAVHPDDRQSVMDAVNACVEHDAPYDIEHRVVWPDGSVRWLLERGATTRDTNGTPLQMLGVVEDIDDRKRTELALAERERQLHEAQSLARIGNWQANIITGELTWSDEIFRIFGYEPDSFEPSVEAFKASVHPDDLDRVHESEKNAEQTGSHDVVHRIVQPDGTVRHVHELAQAESDENGKLIRLSGTVQDITEQVAAEQELITARDDADRANQAKSDFLSSMSHELRTPMNAILGFGQLLEFDDALGEDQQDSISEILKAGQHLLELINEVLDLAKVESGHIDLSLESVDVGQLIDECFGLVLTLAEKRNIHLNHCELKGACVRADNMRLKQVLLNLLSNAIKYNKVGGRVNLEVKHEGADRVRILVTDTGPGIPSEKFEDLFLPFNRLDAESGDIEGTGIGLTITRRIVELMGGIIDVKSEVGVGSTFWIELPVAHQAETDVSDKKTVLETNTTDSHQEPDAVQHTLLYIEDNPANLKLVANILRRRKHTHLLKAHNPELGLELAQTNRPDLILLDINMPGMNGYQVLEALKADENLKSIPVIAVTANAMPRDIERGKAAGFSDYLVKPLNIGQFLKTLDDFLAD